PLAARLTATPFLRLDAASFDQARFAEQGATDFDLLVAGHTTDSVATTLGAKLTREFDMGWSAPLVGSLKAGWGHEFADTARPVTAAFAGAPLIPFTVQGARVDRDVAVLGASLSATTGNMTLFAKFDGQYGARSRASAVTAGLSVNW
ncbi:MAG: autotransporter outer membrane beta-barrel domain-containing protein, partial [Methylobacteriaceae bacterium]|nr:autotransporter outer membrane beta-barrel domain-containing protein [Methylobacteriaceae bacterium]